MQQSYDVSSLSAEGHGSCTAYWLAANRISRQRAFDRARHELHDRIDRAVGRRHPRAVFNKANVQIGQFGTNSSAISPT